MSDLNLIYITCESERQALTIGRELMGRRLVACINVIPRVTSLSFWPPQTGKIEQASEVVLICKTTAAKWKQIEAAVRKLHSYDNPFIAAIPLSQISKQYADWLSGEIK